MKQKFLRLLPVLLALVAAGTARAQVSYSEDFNAGTLGGWTSGGGAYGYHTTDLPCSGSGSARANLYGSFSSTWTLSSPLVGTTLGGVIILSFDYKVTDYFAGTAATPNPWGSVNVQYASSSTGPWTTVATIDATNHTPSSTCATKSYTFLPPSAGSLYVRFDAVLDPTLFPDFYLYFDNISIAEGSATPCTGPPSGGTASSSEDSVCTAQSFTLDNTGFTLAPGISMQWQKDVAGIWTDIPGATGKFYSATQSATTSYRMRVICTAGPDTSYSVPVTVIQNPYTECYCGPAVGTQLHNLSFGYPYVDNLITNVAISGTTLNSTAASPPLSGTYIGYTETLAPPANHTGDLGQGILHTITATVLPSAETIIAWFDYDQDGIFASSEAVSLTKPSSSATTATASFIVPATASLGTTRMRLRAAQYSFAFSTTDACTLFMYDVSETEDRLVNVAVFPPCSGTPDGGTAIPSIAAACPAEIITIVDTGYTVGVSGITYQWQRRNPSGTGTWTNILSATTPTLNITQTTATDYRLVVTCGTGAGATFDNSNEVTVTMNPSTLCYCSPLTGTSLHSYPYGNMIDSVSIATTTLNNVNVGTPPDGYTRYATPPISNTAILAQNSAYKLYLSVDPTAYSPGGVGAWIDYDQNGSFDPSEFIKASLGTTGYTFIVPITSTLGTTGMRIRCGQYSTIVDSFDACTDLFYGETEDYTVTIEGPKCPAPSAPVVSVTMAGAALSWGSVVPATSYEYAVTDLATPPAAGTPTTALSATVTGLTAGASYYAHVRARCGATDSSIWVSTPFTVAFPCPAPASLTTSEIGAYTVKLTWPAAGPGVTSYQYGAATAPTPPALGLGSTPGLSGTVGGLTLWGSTYYGFVRSVCDGIVSTWTENSFTKEAAGLDDPSAAALVSFTAAPNPATDLLTVILDGARFDGAELRLSDMAGRTVRTLAPDAAIVTMPVADLPAGVYLLRYSDSKQAHVIRVVKQ